jgi:hypothetical protein
LAFNLQFTADTEEHLQSLSAVQQAQVMDAVAEQHAHQPNVVTRNRKIMRANKLAA